MSTAHPFSTTTPPPPQQQRQHIYPNLRPPTTPNPNPPNPSQGILYPVASSGRGFIPKPSRPNSNASDQTVTVANPGAGAGGYPPRPNQLLAYHPRQHLDASVSNHHPVHHHHHHMIRPQFTQQQQHHYHHPQISPPIRGIPVSSVHPKVSPSPSSDTNGYKSSRDKKDESIAVIRDRKVRISDGASLYSLCRSWLRNGYPEESQPEYGDVIRTLPRPSPMPKTEVDDVKKEGEEENCIDKEEDEDSVDDLSAKDLLKRHVERAKRVRAGLREQRAKRIERYKTRLSLLLPPLVEQPRNDASAGN